MPWKNGILILLSIARRQILSGFQQHHLTITQQFFRCKVEAASPTGTTLSEQIPASEFWFCQGGEGDMVPFGFRYARHFDEPKAEISRVSALLLSWSHLHGIYSPARHTACLPSLAKSEFAGRHLLTEGVSDRAAVSALQRKDICVIDTGLCIADRFSRVHNHIAFT